MAASSSGGTMDGQATSNFDEHWLRLAIAIHECSTNAMKNVLDNVISAKHADLQCKPFKEKLQQVLVRDEAQLRLCLLKYEVPQVFPPVPCVYPAPYQSLDIGIVAKLVKYYAGNAVWQASCANLPDMENLHNFDFVRASNFALVELLRELRNWVFHYTGSPPLTSEDFANLWDGLMNILGGLGYDISKVKPFKAGALGIGGQMVVTAIMEESEILLRRINEEKMADRDAILSLKSEMASKDELKNVSEKLGAQIHSLSSDIQKLIANENADADASLKFTPEMASTDELKSVCEASEADILALSRGSKKQIKPENSGAAPQQSASFWQSSMPGWLGKMRMRGTENITM